MNTFLSPIKIMETALVFDHKREQYFDCIITVIAEESTRIDRVIKRDGLDIETVKSKIRNQTSDYVRIHGSDFIIINEESSKEDDDVEKQIEYIFNLIYKL